MCSWFDLGREATNNEEYQSLVIPRLGRGLRKPVAVRDALKWLAKFA